MANSTFKQWKARDRYGNHIALVGWFDRRAFAKWLGITLTEYETVRRTMQRTDDNASLCFFLCDKVLTGAGDPHLTHELYVIERRFKVGSRFRKSREG